MDGQVLERLVIELTADVTKLDSKLSGVTRSIKTHAGQWQAALTEANVEKSLERMFDSSRLAVLEEGGARLRVFGSALEPLGAFGIAAAAGITAAGLAIESALKFGEWSEGLERTSKALGLTTTQIQEFDYVATAAGIPVDKMRESLTGLDRTIGQVESGFAKSTTVKVFTDALKITPEQLRGWGDLEHQLPHVIEALASLNVQERNGVVAKLKLDPEVVNSWIAIRGEVAGLISDARKFGYVIDEDVIKKAAEASDKLHVAAATISHELMPAFADLLGPLVTATTALARFIDLLGKMPVAKGTLGAGMLWGIPGVIASESFHAFHRAAQYSGLATPDINARLGAALTAGGYAAVGPTGIAPSQLTSGTHHHPAGDAASVAKAVQDQLDQAMKALDQAMAALTGDILEHANLEKRAIADELKHQNDDLDAQAEHVRTDKALKAAQRKELLAQIEVTRQADQQAADAKDQAIQRKAQRAIDAQILETQTAWSGAKIAELQAWLSLHASSPTHHLQVESRLLQMQQSQELDNYTAGLRSRTDLSQDQRDELTSAFLKQQGAAWANEGGQQVPVTALQNLRSQLTGIFSSAMDAGIRGGWPGLLQYLGQSLERTLIDKVASGLANSLTGPSGGGGFGSIISSIFGLPKFAGGTDFAPGGLSLVGERGPELVNLPRGSQVIPNAGSMRGGGGTVMHFDLRGAVMTQDLLNQMNAMATHAATVSGTVAYQSARASIPADMARRASLQLR